MKEAPAVGRAVMRAIRAILVAGAVAVVGERTFAGELPPADGRTNLAAGRPVLFVPASDYRLTHRNDTDDADLTDGRLTERADRHIWFDSSAVSWSYGGRVNLAVDLGRTVRIDEIAMRLLGGSPQAGISFPGWVEAFVSGDGEHYVKVAECSRWRPGELRRFGVPDDAGKAWIHCLRFTGLQARGRWIGLRLYATGLMASDELYVFGSPLDSTTRKETRPESEFSEFTVRHPQPYFHKPELVLATNVCLPVPVGIVVPEARAKAESLEMTLELPPGIKLCGGQIGGQAMADASRQALGDGSQQYRFVAQIRSTTKTFGRLYLQAAGYTDGQTGTLRYQFQHAGWKSPQIALPVRAAEVPRAPCLNRIMVGLGWWHAVSTAEWPTALDVWQHLGLNSFPLFACWMPEGDPLWTLVEQARRRGFRIVNIDSPLHRMLSRRAKQQEIYDQVADGRVGQKLCVSYRGRYYREEVERFAQAMARARPDLASLDIEVWGWRGPVDCRQCTRCQKDFTALGLNDWAAWQAAKGNEIWRDLVTASRTAIKQAGGNPTFEIGGYDFRPGSPYQAVWSVDALYPEWMQSGQVSTYTCLYPYHLALIGDAVRKDRAQLSRSDLLPWLTPGDAGTFPGESFQWALLECYLNGARGIYFWSGRVWDSESLIAMNRVVRAIAPVERVIVDGELAGDTVRTDAPGRVSGMRRGNEMVLLAADYFRRTGGTVTLHLQLPARCRVRDLLNGDVLQEAIGPGEQTLPVPLTGQRARFLHIQPLD